MNAPDARIQLILDHQRWAASVAWGLVRTLGGNQDADDLMQDAYVGLCKAARAYNPAVGVAFITFALPRVRGEVLDRIRDADTLSRSDRRAWTARARAISAFEAAHGRRPEEHELAEILDLTVRQLRSLEQRVARIEFVVPLDADRDDELAGTHLDVADERVAREFADIDLGDLRQSLPARERVVLWLADEGCRLREIGAVLGVTEARACQIRARALRRVAESLELASAA